jgi:hypothetical protein
MEIMLWNKQPEKDISYVFIGATICDTCMFGNWLYKILEKENVYETDRLPSIKSKSTVLM